MPHLWFFAALIAAALWGFSYATTGRILEHHVPVSFLLLTYAGTALPLYIFLVCQKGAFWQAVQNIGTQKGLWTLMILSNLAAVLASLCITYSIAQKNATIASLIEISYPFFTLFFAWLLFREIHLTLATAAGAVLVFAGITVIYVKG